MTAAPSGGEGTIAVTFGFPPSAFLYQATTPKLRINGTEHPVPSWGTHHFLAPPGAHRLEAWVPYAVPRRAGRAAANVTVPVGGVAEVEYMAPTVTFARGSMGVPGQQPSTGLTAVRTLNLVVLVALVVALVVILAIG